MSKSIANRPPRLVPVVLAAVIAGITIALVLTRPGESAQVQGPPKFFEMLRATVHYDFDPFPEVADMTAASELAAAGTVSNVQDGLITGHGEEDQGVFLVTIDPAINYKDEAPPNPVTFALPRPTNVSSKELANTPEIGATMAIFGYRSTATVVDLEGEPLPSVFNPEPQGVFFSADGKTVENLWDTESWPEITSWAELEAAAKTP